MVPALDWNAPAAQSTHADRWLPARLTDLPVAQAVHWLAPADGAIAPSAQSRHTVWPVRLWYCAALHSRQADVCVWGWYLPALQAVHTLWPATPADAPAPHETHTVAPVSDWYRPTAHAVHAELSAALENVPGAQAVQTNRPDPVEAVPAAQLEHPPVLAKPVFPGLQASHAVLLELPVFPAAQTVQDPAPAAEKVLAEQVVQSPDVATLVESSVHDFPAGQAWHSYRLSPRADALVSLFLAPAGHR